MNAKNETLKGKIVYICSPLRSADLSVQTENQKAAQRYVAEYEEQYGCRAIAPHAWLPYLLNDEIPAEREIALDFDRKMLDLCDALVVFGDHLSDGMKLEIDYAQFHGIPVLSRPESCEAVLRYLRSIGKEAG